MELYATPGVFSSMRRTVLAWLLLCFARCVPADILPAPVEADVLIPDLSLSSGEVVPQFRLHYRTLGTLIRDETGLITNAVLLLHGAAQGADDFLSEQFAAAMFGPDQPLDARRYFLILPDVIGNGKSDQPGEAVGARAARYSAEDIVRAQYRLVLEHLGVNHLRLIIGNTSGGRQAWVWGWTYPYFVDALVAIDCLASQPDWIADVVSNSTGGMAAANNEDRQQAVANEKVALRLETVRAEVVAIVSEEVLDQQRLATLQREIARIRNGRYLIIPADRAAGRHGTFAVPQKWRVILPELLEHSEAH